MAEWEDRKNRALREMTADIERDLFRTTQPPVRLERLPWKTRMWRWLMRPVWAV